MDLKTYLEKNLLNKMEFALKLKISLGHLSQIIAGTRRPSVTLAKAIESVTEGAVSKAELMFPEDFS